MLGSRTEGNRVSYPMGGHLDSSSVWAVREFPASGIYGLRFWKVVLISTLTAAMMVGLLYLHLKIGRSAPSGPFPESVRKLCDLHSISSLGGWFRTTLYLLTGLTAWGLSSYRFRVRDAQSGNYRLERVSVWAYVTTYCVVLSLCNATDIHLMIPRMMSGILNTPLVPGMEHSWWLIPTLLIGGVIVLRMFCVICFSGFATLFLMVALAAAVVFCLPYFGYAIPIPLPQHPFTGIEQVAVTLIGPWALLTTLLVHASWIVDCRLYATTSVVEAPPRMYPPSTYTKST